MSDSDPWHDDSLDPGVATAPDDDPRQEPNPLDALFKHLAELAEYAQYYLETRADQVKLRFRNVLVLFVASVLALAVATSLVAAAAVLALAGLAGALGELLGGRPWLGGLLTGGGVLVALGLGGWLAIRRLNRAVQVRLARKYENRRQDLHNRFGREPGPH